MEFIITLGAIALIAGAIFYARKRKSNSAGSGGAKAQETDTERR